MLRPNDIAGHFGGTTLLLLLERGNARDVEAWSESLIERVAKHDSRSVATRCTPPATAGLAALATRQIRT